MLFFYYLGMGQEFINIKYMGKHFILFGSMLLMITFQVRSQEEGSSGKFAYRSFSVSPLGIYVGVNNGLAFSGDVSFDFGKEYFFFGSSRGIYVGS